jgi:hypothetical protein
VDLGVSAQPQANNAAQCLSLKASFWPQAGFRRRRGDAAVSLSIGASIKSKQPAATVEDFGNDRALFLASRYQSHRGLLPQAPDGVFGPVEGDTLHFTECHLSCSNTSTVIAVPCTFCRGSTFVYGPFITLLSTFYISLYVAKASGNDLIGGCVRSGDLLIDWLPSL